jgi:hypothetical protein
LLTRVPGDTRDADGFVGDLPIHTTLPVPPAGADN